MLKTVVKISEEELIDLLQKNLKEGIGLLYDNYSAAIYGVIIKIVGSEDIAQDILQETFVKIWKNFSQYNAEKGRLFTWIINIARNRAIDYTRSKDYKQRERNSVTTDFKAKTEDTTEINIDKIGLNKAINSLAPEVQLVIETIYFKGYSHSEASEYLNMPIGTVKTRVRNGLKELRKVMN